MDDINETVQSLEQMAAELSNASSTILPTEKVNTDETARKVEEEMLRRLRE